MLHLPHLILFFAAAFLLAITPGPGLFYVAARTLAGGRAEGMASTFGTGFGGMVHVIAGSLGVSAIVLANAELFAALKLIGAFYLVFMGFRTLQSARRESAAALTDETVTTSVGPRRAFREGILVEATNPKTAAFFLAFIPQFVDLTRGHVALQFLLLGFISVALNTIADAGVTLAANRIRQSATARPSLIRRLREVSGCAMIALGIGLALTKRPAT
jgi:threonine/homoserine/homoserine lactone efflux protein